MLTETECTWKVGGDHIVERCEYHSERMPLKISKKENETVAWPDLSRTPSKGRCRIDSSMGAAGMKGSSEDWETSSEPIKIGWTIMDPHSGSGSWTWNKETDFRNSSGVDKIGFTLALGRK